MTRTVIVTGGAGFIGSNFLCTILALTDWRVVVVNKLTYAGDLLNLQDVESHPRFTFVGGDIANRRVINSVLGSLRPAAVINSAARRYAIDCSLIERELHWTTRMSFREGIRLTAQWYLENRRWSRAIAHGHYDGERLDLAMRPENV